MTERIECAFIARAAKNAELRTSQNGKPWLSFSAVVGKDDASQWVQVAVFGDAATALDGQLKAGSKVYVEGRLTLRNWEAKDGMPRHGISVAAWKCELLAQIGRDKPPRPSSDKQGPQRNWMGAG